MLTGPMNIKGPPILNEQMGQYVFAPEGSLSNGFVDSVRMHPLTMFQLRTKRFGPVVGRQQVQFQTEVPSVPGTGGGSLIAGGCLVG